MADEDVNEVDIILSIDYLLSKHRSIFLDQKVYDLSSSSYDLLKSHMVKALDMSESESVEL